MKDFDAKMGGSMVYVMVLITFLAILSTGFLYMTEYSRRLVVNNHSYIEAQTTARSIHQSFCESVSGGTSEAMNTLWSCFEEDCEVIWEEYSELAGEEEGEAAEGEPAGDADDTVMEGEPAGDPGDETTEDPLSWEAFLRERLGDKEYVIKGSTGQSERVSIRITLTALPLEGRATVSTTAACNGYRVSMMGDILFNDTEGNMLELGNDVSICTRGSGVYRYYGGTVTKESPDTSSEAAGPRA